MHEFGLRTMPPQLIAILTLERRAAHYPTLSTVFGQPVADRLQPGIPVVIVEGDGGLHLRDVGGRVKVVGVGERHAQPLRHWGPARRLARSRLPHHDDW